MKKISFLLLFLGSFLILPVFALEELQNVGIAKYAVLETIKSPTPIPLREKNNEDAKRLSHLFENTVLYADKQTKDYFRIELEENNYAWINKKHVELQAIIPEKRLDSIDKITFRETKDKYLIEIQTQSNPPFIFQEDKNNLNFNLYDIHFDPTNIKEKSIPKNIVISDKIEDNFKFNYENSNSLLFGYDINKTDKGYEIFIKKAPKINKTKPLKNIKVTLDAGHGGDESGVCAFDLKEKDINLQITKKLKKEMKKRGAKVYLTRKKDKKIGLYERCNFAKEKNSDILLSIHQNSLPNPKNVDKKHGTGTYYYHNQSKPLAQSIKDCLVSATNFKDDGINERSFALVRPTSQISVLVECGYLIKEDEALKLKDKKFQKLVAKAITKGCENYLKANF